MAKKQPDWHQDALDSVRFLRQGGTILHSTDTVWGLGADSTCEAAVHRIFEIKRRPLSETLLMLVAAESTLEQLLPNLPDAAWELLEVSDRPITLVGTMGPRHPFDFAPGMVREDGSIAVRLVTDPYLQFLINGIGRPLASTSANLRSQPTPSDYHGIDDEVIQSVQFAAAYRRKLTHPVQASMLVQFDEAGRIQILRS